MFVHTGLRFVVGFYLGGFSNRSGCRGQHSGVNSPEWSWSDPEEVTGWSSLLTAKTEVSITRSASDQLVTSRLTLPVTRGDGLCAILCSSHFSLNLEDVSIGRGPQGCSLPGAPTLLQPPPPLPAAPISCLHLPGPAPTNHGQALLCQRITGRRQTVVLAWLPVLSQPSEIWVHVLI